MTQENEFFDEESRIERHKVVLYHSPYCGFSRRALQILQERGETVEVVIALGEERLRRWLRQVTGQYTLPQVFISGRSVGGHSDLLRLQRDGALDSLLGTSNSGPGSEQL